MDFPKTVSGVNLLDGVFTDGDPANGVPASLDPAEWANAVTHEILNVITAAELEPDEATTNQLLTAIQALIAAGNIEDATEAAAGLMSAADKVKLDDITDDQPANHVYAGPTSGADAPPGYRALVVADLPDTTPQKNAANAFSAQQSVTPYRANISGAVSIDLAATAKSNNLYLTLTGNVSSFALTNAADGAVYNIKFIQDATGGRTITLPAEFKFAYGSAPSFSAAAGAVDFLSALYDATSTTYMSAFSPGMA